MIDLGIVLITGIFWYLGKYAVAFWIVAFAIANGLLGTARAILSPAWYHNQRRAAGLDSDFTDPKEYVPSLLLVKAVTIIPLSLLAWYLATLAGYL